MNNIRNQYPMMKPYVGKNYVRNGEKSLLLIGESHYLPKDSKQHLTPHVWYSGDYTTLSDKERTWISTPEIIERSRAEGLRNKAHSIYRNAFREINDYGPKHSDYRDVADDVVFYNYFQRPALTGQSLVVCKEDLEIAEQCFREAIDLNRPALVVFLSTLAYWKCAIGRQSDVQVVFTPHPGCIHWHRRIKWRRNKRGRDILAAAISTLYLNKQSTETR